ncbi:MAG: M24 family metallopeptidase, partial [Elusimicrobiota bacterium]
NLSDGLKEFLLLNPSIRRIGFDPEKVTLNTYKKIIKTLGNSFKFKPASLISDLRQVKNADEIEKIKKSCAISVKVINLIKRIIKPGDWEMAVSDKIKKMFLEFGAESAFSPIVASSPNSAYPHHISTNKKIPENCHVLIDIGAKFRGYCSDLTRVIFLGKINFIYRRHYDNSIAAQHLSLKAIKPGVKTGEIDKAARSFFAKSGLKEHFIHSTGHGVGIEVHEKPQLLEGGKEKLSAGMVVTIEPGLYYPGTGGVRVEDTVLVTENGYEILTKGVN